MSRLWMRSIALRPQLKPIAKHLFHLPILMTQRSRLTVKRRKGFILLTVVFLIVFSSLLLVGTSRRTIQVSLRAKVLKSELQRKWGSVSIERVVLKNASKILNPNRQPVESDEAPPLPTSTATYRLMLGELVFEIDLFDEQAKINLSTILANRNQAYLENLLNRSCDPSLLRLEALNEDPANLNATQFNSWGHVFDIGQVPPSQIHLFARKNLGQITLWGAGGKMNFRTASKDSLKSILRLALSPIEADQFISEFEADPTLDLKGIGAAAGFSVSELENLNRLLTPNSSTYSIWVTARDKGAISTRCVVREAITPSQSRHWVFQW